MCFARKFGETKNQTRIGGEIVFFQEKLLNSDMVSRNINKKK